MILMRVFFDANVLIDVLMRRTGWRSSLALIQNVRDGKIEGYISALTVAIIYFLRARSLPEAESKDVAKRIIHGFKVAPLTEDVIKRALEEQRIEDLEDAIQFHSAKEVAEVFITRNKRDFRAVKDEIEILTPEEFLEKYRLTNPSS